MSISSLFWFFCSTTTPAGFLHVKYKKMFSEAALFAFVVFLILCVFSVFFFKSFVLFVESYSSLH